MSIHRTLMHDYVWHWRQAPTRQALVPQRHWLARLWTTFNATEATTTERPGLYDTGWRSHIAEQLGVLVIGAGAAMVGVIAASGIPYRWPTMQRLSLQAALGNFGFPRLRQVFLRGGVLDQLWTPRAHVETDLGPSLLAMRMRRAHIEREPVLAAWLRHLDSEGEEEEAAADEVATAMRIIKDLPPSFVYNAWHLLYALRSRIELPL